ncbi:MAG: hypothetical protein K1X39_14780 [Thermoflexales bacterium]|nr:hypothetical protein [Thermoflexales bacterium]
MQSNELSAAAGVLLSLAFSYLPGLRPWYAAQTSEKRSLVMLAALVATGLLAFGVSCSGLQPVVTCSAPGFKSLVIAIGAAAAANVTTYTLTRRIAPATEEDTLPVPAGSVNPAPVSGPNAQGGEIAMG